MVSWSEGMKMEIITVKVKAKKSLTFSSKGHQVISILEFQMNKYQIDSEDMKYIFELEVVLA